MVFYPFRGIIGGADCPNCIGREVEGIGKEVKYVAVTPDQVYESLMAMGTGEFAANLYRQYSIAYAAGWGDFTTNDVETVTGHKSRSFKQFVEEVFAPILK